MRSDGEPEDFKQSFETDDQPTGFKQSFEMPVSNTKRNDSPPAKPVRVDRRTRGHQLPPESWAEIKKATCAGVSVKELAAIYGISPQTINSKATNERWPTPFRLAKSGLRAALAISALPNPYNPDQLTKDSPNPDQITKDSAKTEPPKQEIQERLALDLQNLLEAPPEAFQAAFSKYAQGVLAQGLAGIPAPRNVNELKIWFEIWRKASLLDQKNNSTVNLTLVNPMRTVRRRSPEVLETPIETVLECSNEQDSSQVT